FRCAFEALGDQPARFLAGLASDLLAARAETLRQVGAARSLDRQLAVVAVIDDGVGLDCSAVGGAFDHLVGSFGEVSGILVSHGHFSFADSNGEPRGSFRAAEAKVARLNAALIGPFTSQY